MQFGRFFKSNVSKPIDIDQNTSAIASTSVPSSTPTAVTDLIERWQRVVKAKPGAKHARLQLLEAYASAYQWSEVDTLLNALEADYPNDYQVRLNIVKVIQRKESEREAKESWIALHKDYPDMIDPIIGLARCHNLDDEQEEALILLEKALAIDPTDSRACLIKGKINQRQGNLDEASEIYMSILSREPRHYEAETNLSSILFKQGSYEELLARLKKSIQMHPEQTSFKMFLFRVYVKMERYTDALKVIDGLMSRDGRKPKVEYYLEKSDLLLKLDRSEEADELCEAALGSYPNNLKLLTLYARVGQRRLKTA